MGCPQGSGTQRARGGPAEGGRMRKATRVVGLALLVLLASVLSAAAGPATAPDEPPTVADERLAAPPKGSDDAPSAAADPVKTAEDLAARGRELYADGRFAEAVAAYREAHDQAPTGALLYNIAYIYDKKMGETDLAMEFYRRCIGSPDTDPDLSSRATARLGALRAEKEGRTEPPEGGGGLSKKTWGWITLGSGAGVLLTGLTLSLLANEDHEAFQSSRDLDDKKSLRDRGQKKALAGDVLMGVGAAAVVAGTVLVALFWDEDPASGSVSTSFRFEPTVIPGGAALMIGGSY